LNSGIGEIKIFVNSKLKVSNFSGNRLSSLILDDKERVIEEIKDSLEIARKLECKQIMLLSDVLKSDGSVEASLKNREEKLLRLYENLKEIIKITEKEKILLVIEPLNTIKDHKNYFLDNFQTTLELVKSINSEHLKILYDIYHMQIMEGNILETLQKYHQFIGYIHIANVPYRCEPWIGELDFKFILKELSKVYSGFVGFEFFVKEKSFTYEELYKWIRSIDF